MLLPSWQEREREIKVFHLPKKAISLCLYRETSLLFYFSLAGSQIRVIARFRASERAKKERGLNLPNCRCFLLCLPWLELWQSAGMAQSENNGNISVFFYSRSSFFSLLSHSKTSQTVETCLQMQELFSALLISTKKFFFLHVSRT